MLRLHLFVALVHQGGEDVEEVLVEAVPVLPGLPQVGLDEGRHHYYRLTITTLSGVGVVSVYLRLGMLLGGESYPTPCTGVTIR